PARYLATIANTGSRGVARQFRQLQGRSESFLHRLALVAGNGPQPTAPTGILLAQLASSIVLLDRTFLRHQYLLAFRPSSLPEREVKRAQQRSRLVVGLRAGAYRDIPPPDVGDLVIVDLREDHVFFDPHRII